MKNENFKSFSTLLEKNDRIKKKPVDKQKRNRKLLYAGVITNIVCWLAAVVPGFVFVFLEIDYISSPISGEDKDYSLIIGFGFLALLGIAGEIFNILLLLKKYNTNRNFVMDLGILFTILPPFFGGAMILVAACRMLNEKQVLNMKNKQNEGENEHEKNT